MNTVQASVGLDATALKLLGVATMTVDHIGYILCPDLVLLRILREIGLSHLCLPDRRRLYIFQA